MSYSLKRLSRANLEAAITKAAHYRDLNQPEEAESICRDVLDVDAGTLAKLVQGGYATVNGLTAVIGGLEAPLAQLSQYDRSGIMIHCGGSNAPDPLADNQGLYRTFGCTRMLNADWRELAAWLQPLEAGNVIVYTALETPADLGQ